MDRHRVVRQRAEAAVEGHQDAPGQRPGRLPQGHRLPDPADGRRVRQLLHARGHDHPHPRVPVARRGDEEDRAEGGEAVLWHGRRGAAVHQGRGAALLLQELLEPADGAGQTQLSAARRHHCRDRQ